MISIVLPMPVPTNADVPPSSPGPSSAFPAESPDNNSSPDTSNTHVLLCRTSRVNAGKPPAKFDSWITDIAHYISYASIPLTYKSFLVSLHSVLVPGR